MDAVSIAGVAVPIAFAVALTACDETIDPFQATEMAYSIHGHLDAHADTQWVRVAPFRTSIFSSPDPVDAVVTLEDLATGRMIELIQTPFAQVSSNFGDTLFAANFRTTEPIDYTATYRLTARRSDGSIASSDVSIPKDHSHLPSTVGISQAPFAFGAADYVRFHLLPGTYLAMVPTRRYSSADPACRLWRHNAIPHIPYPEDGGEIQVYVLPPEYPGNCVSDRTDIGIIRSWEPWPFAGINDYTNVLAHTNVENGVGYLGGLTITSVPFEDCVLVGREAPEFCELYYAPDTATLLVQVFNVSGFPKDYPVDRELYPFRAETMLTRGNESWSRRPGSVEATTDPDASGVLRFPGLVPGRYHLLVEGEVGVAGIYPAYCEERTLDVGPGETSIDILITLLVTDPDEPVNANGCREG